MVGSANNENNSANLSGGKRRFRRVGALAAVLAVGAAVYAFWPEPAVTIDYNGPVAGWERWGGGDGGTRYSPLTQITPENVAALKPAWTYHVGEIKAADGLSPTFEATPITAEGRLYVCSGSGRIAALDPETGKEIWAADPKSDYTSSYLINCRGVTYVRDSQVPQGEACAGRIFAGTVDNRLVSLDAKTGKLCAMFGAGGILDLKPGLGDVERGDLSISSPPVVIGDTIVVNSRVSDNMRVDMPAGVIRAFDVHSGKLAWAWNAVPPGMSDQADAPKGESFVRATPNSWAPMSADPKLGLVFVPMGNAAPDHFGGNRNGLDYYASSVVALDAATGAVRWHFQTVHHDVWDYDIPAQPVVFDLPTADGVVPALAQTTKQGHIFVLDRRTGKPLFPVEERPVPQGGAVPGEKLSPTQPFPANPAFIIRSHDLTEADMWGFTPWDRSRCRALYNSVNNEGIFTPPSIKGSIQYPSFQGASNWGGITIDPERSILIANTQQVASIMQLVPRDEIAKRTEEGEHILPASGSPYGLVMKPMLSPFGAPCNEPPWGTLVAIDLTKGKRLWEVPLGTTRDQAPFPIWLKLGVPNLGGSIVTASGLVFIGATTDDYLRAYDIKSGEVLWRARLPGGGQATPMTYRLNKNGRQYVVIAAGGHKYLGTTVGDSLVAYALPAADKTAQ